MALYRTITQRCAAVVQDERIAGGTIKPGHLVELYAASATVQKVQVHAVASTNASAIFAVEDELQGSDLADSYASGSVCRFRTFRAGDLIVAWIKANETIAIGTKLESGGAGNLQVFTTDAPSAGEVDTWVATAEVALTGNTTDTLCLVRIR